MKKFIHVVAVAWAFTSCSSFNGRATQSGNGAKKLTDGNDGTSAPIQPGAGDCKVAPISSDPKTPKAALASDACVPSAPVIPPNSQGQIPTPGAPTDLVPVDSVPLSPEVKSCLGTAGIVQFSKAGLANVRKLGGSSFAPFASNKITDDPQEYSDDPNNPAPAIVLITVSNIGPVGNSDIELLNRNALYCFLGQSSFTVMNNTKITICKGAKLSMGAATGLGGAMGDQMSSMIGTNPSVGTQSTNKLWISCKN